MEKPDRRPISLAGLGLVSAGAVLGLALATPASAAPSAAPSARPSDTLAPRPAPVAERDARP
jgi:hypothetical protein